MPKRKKRILLGILFFLTITLLAALLTVHTSKFRSYVLSKIDQRLRNNFNLSLSAKSLDLDLFRLSASFEDLKIIPLAPDESILQSFGAQRLSINLSSKTLLGKRIQIQKFHVTEPEVRLSKAKRIPLATKEVRPPSSEPFSFRIDEFLLESGKIDYRDNEFPITASIDDIALNIHFEKGDAIHKGILTTRSGKIEIFESQFFIDKFLTEFAFDDHSIQIARLLCETEPLHLSASGQVKNYQINPQYQLVLQGTLRMDSLNKIPEIGPNFEGLLSVTTSITGMGPDLTWEGQVQGTNLCVADIALKNLGGDFSGDRTHLALRNFKAEDTDGNLEGDLSLSFVEGGHSTLKLRWTSLGLSALKQRLPKFTPLLSSRTSGYLTATWKKPTLESLDAEGEFLLDSSSIDPSSSTDILDIEGNIEFQAKNGIFTLLPSSVSLYQTHLAISGTLESTKKFKLKYQLKSKDLKDAERLFTLLRSHGLIQASPRLKPFQLNGQLLLAGEASGSLEQPKATLAVTARDIVYNTHTFGNLDAELNYTDAQINIVTFSIGTERGGMTMEGYVLIDPFEKSFIPSAELILRASNADIAPLTSLTQEKYPVRGFFSGEATLSGKLADPSVRFSGIFNDLAVNHEDFNSLTIRGQYLNRNLTLEKLSIVKSEGVLEGSLGLDLTTQTFDIDFEGRAIDLSTFRPVDPGEAEITGTIQFQLKGSGTIENPAFSLQLSMENIRAQSIRVESLSLNAESDGRMVDIQIETPVGQTSVAATLALKEPYIIQGQLKTESIDIWHTIRSGLEPLPSPIASQISATADFVIPLRDWTNARFFLSFDKGSFRYKDLTLQARQPILIKIEKGELIIEDLSIQGPQTEFTVSGSLPLTEKHANNIRINGSLNLRLLEALFPGSEASGLLEIEGNLSGSLLEPVLNATMGMDEGHLVSPFIPVNLHGISIKSEIKDNVLHLDQLSAGVGSGNISAKGQILLASLFPGKSRDKSQKQIPQENEIHISLTDLNPGNFTEILMDKMEIQFGGKINGTIRLYGDFASLSSLELEGELTTVEFSLEEFKMVSEEKIQFRMSDGLFNLKRFRLSGGQSFLEAEGKLSLLPEEQIDLHLSASIDSAVLTPLFEETVLGGNLAIDLHLEGNLGDPVVNGQGIISDGFFQMEEPPFLATNLNGTLAFPDPQTAMLSLEGIVNGGSTSIQGKIVYRPFAIVSTRLEARTTGIQVSYPEGFQAISDGTITLEKKEEEWFLGGDIKITQSYYNGDIYPGGELINTLRSQRRALRSDMPPYIRDLNLNLELSTVDALIVENNVADLELDANIRVSGTAFDPLLSGFIRSRQTGQIVFGNHVYEVEQASLDYLDADPLEGQLSVTSHTQIRHGYENLKVTLTLSGTITNLEFGLSSSPARSEIELASLLITGYGTEKLRDEVAGVIGDQLMLYFLSPIASPFTNRVKNFLRAEAVTLEPINIASEEDPGARFTFRKGLIHALHLIYSIDISDTQKQAWILDYNLSRNFGVQSFAKDDGSYGASFSHRFFFGGSSRGNTALPAYRHKQFIIKDIRIEGNPIFPERDLNRMTQSLKRGSAFSYRDLRKTINALEKYYKANDYLNAVIKPTLQRDNSNSMTIILNITPNNPVAIAFEGDSLSKKLKREVIDKWNGRLPVEMSVSHAKKQILRDLNSKARLEAEVKESTIRERGRTIYVFSINLGPKYRIRNFTLVGQSSIPPKMIKDAVSRIPKAKGKGLWALLADFKRAKLRIESDFAETGYQNAVISPPQVQFDRKNRFVDISLPIDQGTQSRISTIRITGNLAITESDLRNILRMKEGDVFAPTPLAADTNMLYSYCRSRGYHDVKINIQIFPDPDEASIGLLYTIQEGAVHTIASVEVRGNQRTPEHVIRRELTFKEGDILRTEDLITSQKKLYNLMAFRVVNIRREDNRVEGNKAKILVEVQEDPRISMSYGLRYNSEEKLEGFGQLDLTNLLGRARNGLFFYRQNDRQKDFRFSLKDPYLFGKRFNTLYSFFYKEEIESLFQEDLWGLSIQQQLQLSLHSSFSYLFRIKNIRSFWLEHDTPYPVELKFFIPEFQVFWVRDTRPSLLNAKQGSFLSLSLTYSPDLLKTDRKYISFFGQYSLYLPISRQVIWASNYRIGLADAFDKVLAPRDLRFLAGGANSLRGFERDMVGPYDPIIQRAIGGEGLFIVNQELRFPLFKLFEGVVFFDFGNVYENLEDFNPFNLRTGAGFGLRLNLPAIFLRLDYGINLAPREHEKRSVIYFSIGQAF